MPPTAPLKLLPVRTVAARLACTPKWVYYLIDAGLLPATRLSPRRLRVSESDLAEWLKNRDLEFSARQ